MRLILLFSLLLPILMQAQTFKSPKMDGTAEPLPNSIINIHAKNLPKKSFSSAHTTTLHRPTVMQQHQDGRPAVIKFRSDEKVVTRSSSEALYQYLDALAPVLKFDEPRKFLSIEKSNTDKLGQHHFLLHQTFQGVPVYGKELRVHADESGFHMVNGDILTIQNLAIKPTLQQDEVLTKLEEYTQTTVLRKTDFGIIKPTANLVIFPDGDQNYLTWEVTYQENLLHTWVVFIDAHNGSIRNKYLKTCSIHHDHHGETAKINPILNTKTAASGTFFTDQAGSGTDLFGNNRSFRVQQTGGVFYMIDASRQMFNASQSQIPNDPVGVIWTIDANNTDPTGDSGSLTHVASTNNQWSDQAAVSAHTNAGIVYEYFLNTHGRNSINGQGGNVVSVVNVADEDGGGLDNAYWNGQMMFYGNGDRAFQPLAKALDVAAHEMSHGVVQNTANLNYQGESGAINESFADVFGSMVDRDDWLIGEDVVNRSVFTSGALRSLMDPNNGGTRLGDNGYQPKSVSEQYFGSENNGGVHINSGIPNHAFYLFAIQVGRDKAEQIYYRALSTYLTRSSNFKNLRFAVEQSTVDLYGNGSELQAAQSAFTQVGILGDSNTQPTPDDTITSSQGEEFMAFTRSDRTGVLLANFANNQVTTIFEGQIRSRISVTDDGSIWTWVAQDGTPHFASFDFENGTFSTDVLINSTNYNSAIISKDGRRVAFAQKVQVPEIIVFDFDLEQFQTFTLFNPTFTIGVQTGDVIYPDAMEFDYSGEFILYDAFNELSSNFGQDIDYWDVGFLKVFDNNRNQFGDGNIIKLFTGLPESHSLGNASYAKTNRNVIVFDYLDETGTAFVRMANYETGKVSDNIVSNTSINYPSLNNDDTQIAVESENNNQFSIFTVPVTENFEPNGSSSVLISNGRWGTFFSNEQRDLSTSNEFIDTYVGELNVFPTIASNQITIELEALKPIQSLEVQITNTDGKILSSKSFEQVGRQFNQQISTEILPAGQYFVTLINTKGLISKKFVVVK